jgi:hypothetical protein
LERRAVEEVLCANVDLSSDEAPSLLTVDLDDASLARGEGFANKAESELGAATSRG